MAAKRTIDFFKPLIAREDIAAVTATLKSGWLTSGPRAREFEHAFAAFVGAKHAVAVNSGTAGLQLALAATGVGPGDEVITTPYTFAATVEVIVHTGATPVFADVEPGGFNLDPLAVEQAITKRTRAVLPVGIGGIPVDATAFRRLARQNKLAFIEDAAHTLGATYRGKPVGTQADITAFSFYATKNLTTGEGGMVTARSKKTADLIRTLSLHGISRQTWARHESGGYRYDVTHAGFKANMSDLSAALGLSQLKRFPRFQKQRAQVDRWYRQLLDGHPVIDFPLVPKNCTSSYHLVQILLDLNHLRVDRDRIHADLKDAGVPCSVHFIPLHTMTYYRRRFGYHHTDFPNAWDSFKRTLTLPAYAGMPKRDVVCACDTLRRILDSNHR